MHLLRSAISVAALLGLALGPVQAAPKGPKGPRVSAAKGPSTKAPKVTKPSIAPKTTAAKGGPKTTTVKAKAARADAKLTRTEARAMKTKKADGATTALTETGPAPSSRVSTTEPVDFTAGKVGERLLKNSGLRSKLEGQLEALGYTGDVYQAGYGFKNLGQFNAAVNNAQNHSLSFEELKIQMTGLRVDPDGVVLRAYLDGDGTVTMVPVSEGEVTNLTPAPTQSLGQAKQTLAAENPEVETTQAGS